jgi:hypothetical protein
MRHRLIIAAAFAAGLAGCSTPSVPKIDFSGMALPRFELFRYGVPETSATTTPYRLTPVELADVKAQFSAEFQDGRTLEFGPVSARRKSSGGLIICGLVNIRTPAGEKSGMSLFDGNGVQRPADGTLDFTPRRVAGANATAIDIYGDCRNAGVL